jgi:hypothetical protein
MYLPIESISFIAAVLGITLLVWLVRSIAESNPDPFLLNLTIFAFAGQCVATAERVREANASGVVFALLLIAVILLLLQAFIIRTEWATTIRHYKEVLESNKVGELSSAEIERWALLLLRITGVDFYPEFYMGITAGPRHGPRHNLRKQAISILPPSEFKVGSSGVTASALIVPAHERKWLWRTYVLICMLSWSVFIVSLLVPAWHE